MTITMTEIVNAIRDSIDAGVALRKLETSEDFADACARNATMALSPLLGAIGGAEQLLDEAEKFCPVELQDRIRAWRREQLG